MKFSTDGTVVALCGAVCPEDEKARISLIEIKTTDRGIQWLADWLNRRYKMASCVVIDGRNGVDFLIEKITSVWKYKKSIVRPSGKDMIAAASQLSQEVNEQTVTWYKYQELLRESAVNICKKDRFQEAGDLAAKIQLQSKRPLLHCGGAGHRSEILTER